MKSPDMDQSFYEVTISENKDERECSSHEICQKSECDRNLCWANKKCQKLDLGKCHPLCAGGCNVDNSPTDCYVCKGLLTKDGTCVSSCPAGRYVKLY